MTIAYFDSSGIVKLLIPGEAGAELALASYRDAPSRATSGVAYPECRAAVAAAVRSSRLDSTSGRNAVEILANLWMTVTRVIVTVDVAQLAGELAARHRLRGFDAIHLASALSVGADIAMVTWDKDLAHAAHDEGLTTIPA